MTGEYQSEPRLKEMVSATFLKVQWMFRSSYVARKIFWLNDKSITVQLPISNNLLVLLHKQLHNIQRLICSWTFSFLECAGENCSWTINNFKIKDVLIWADSSLEWYFVYISLLNLIACYVFISFLFICPHW